MGPVSGVKGSQGVGGIAVRHVDEHLAGSRILDRQGPPRGRRAPGAVDEHLGRHAVKDPALLGRLLGDKLIVMGGLTVTGGAHCW